MKKLAITLFALLAFMTACSQSETNETSAKQTPTTEETDMEKEDTADEPTQSSVDEAEEELDTATTPEPVEDTPQAEEESKTIANGQEAIDYLAKELDKSDNEDIVFDDLGGTTETDRQGTYYTIQLSSKSLQEDGGSGTVGVYKVYENGDYVMK
ncbi:hypothetical protein [Halobacillus salinus]|uniref:Lipoprotein n=1 Tax=Halobacillus salinus TaxID=192814 RepID=A0A4Z0H0H3_9BACI|nr:hypothetical protein [Halobacillus salinus]TGB02478.1 hypothetical protein E4663_14170 [Halobacillus salinus]